jgi:SM-20-related protein
MVTETSLDHVHALRPRAPSPERTVAMLQLARLEAATLAPAPWQWGVVDELFRAGDATELARDFPRDHFKPVTGYDGEKGYAYYAREFIGMGAACASHEESLRPAWRRLARALLSVEYRTAMSRLVGTDLGARVLEVNVFHYGPGSWLGPHVDLKEKTVTHVLYFNQAWEVEQGGCLMILGSKDMTDVVRQVPPIVGNSAVLVRSDVSWHAVAPVDAACTASRQSMTVTFYTPGSISTMWPPGDATPLAPYEGSAR